MSGDIVAGRAGGRRSRESVVSLCLVLVVALVCRLGVFFAFPAVFDFVATGTVHGSTAYDTYARNLLATGTYGLEAGVPDAALPPVYSFVLAGAYALLGRSALAVAGFHTAFDLTAIALLVSIGGMLFRRPAVGVLAGLGVACYPYLVFQSLAVSDTALFVLELHAFLWLTLRLRERPLADHGATAIAVLAGLVVGLGALTRPVLLLVTAATALWFLLGQPPRERLRRLAPLALAAACVLGLWGLRNAVTLGQPVLVATNGGANFWQGNNAETVPYLRAGYDVQWIPPGALGALDHRDPESSRRFLAAALRFLRDHPDHIPNLAWTKLLAQWSLDITPWRNPAPGSAAAPVGEPDLSGIVPEAAVAAYSQPLFDRVGRTVHRVTWGAALVLACLGLVASRRGWRDVSLVWVVQASMTLFYVAFHPSTRYRLPGDPLLFLLSAAGLLALVAASGRMAARARRNERVRSVQSGSAAGVTPRAARRHVADIHDDGLEQQLEAHEQR